MGSVFVALRLQSIDSVVVVHNSSDITWKSEHLLTELLDLEDTLKLNYNTVF